MEAVQGIQELTKREAVAPVSRAAERAQGSRPRRGAEPAAEEAPAAAQAPAGAHSPFVPMLLMLLALVAWFGFHGVQLWNERESYTAAVQRQASRMERAQQFRNEFESLNADTAHLAAVGNANAKQLVDAMKLGGVATDREKSASAGAGEQGPH